jgi:hypothetical protein
MKPIQVKRVKTMVTDELEPTDPLLHLFQRQAEAYGMTVEQYEAWTKTRVPVGVEDDEMPLPWMTRSS